MTPRHFQPPPFSKCRGEHILVTKAALELLFDFLSVAADAPGVARQRADLSRFRAEAYEFLLLIRAAVHEHLATSELNPDYLALDLDISDIPLAPGVQAARDLQQMENLQSEYSRRAKHHLDYPIEPL